MLTVLTPAASTRLTIVEAVARHLQIEPAPDSFSGLIDVASRMIASYCNRPFGRETVRQIGSAPGRFMGLLLERSPATVSSVVVSGTTLPSEEYHLDTETNTLFRLSGGLIGAWGGSVDVTYSAGWLLPGQEGADLPPPVEHAAILVVSALWSASQRDPLVKSESVEGIGRTDYRDSDPKIRLPDTTAEIMLQPYRRYAV